MCARGLPALAYTMFGRDHISWPLPSFIAAFPLVSTNLLAPTLSTALGSRTPDPEMFLLRLVALPIFAIVGKLPANGQRRPASMRCTCLPKRSCWIRLRLIRLRLPSWAFVHASRRSLTPLDFHQPIGRFEDFSRAAAVRGADDAVFLHGVENAGGAAVA